MSHRVPISVISAMMLAFFMLMGIRTSVYAQAIRPVAPRGATGPVSFMREEIALRVDGNRAAVTGRYHLRANQPGTHTVPLAYPFPVGAAAEYPDTIRVFRGKDLAPVIFEEDRARGMVFFRIEAEGEFEFTAFYSQRLHTREATYILTTTKEWGAPLDSADLSVTLPNSLIPTYWSYQPDGKKKGKSSTTYTIHRMNFLPDRNLTVRWKPRKAR